MHVDESHYMRRTMQVLKDLGPQEPTSSYVFAYDHPYFGQLFLAGTLKIIGYPDSLSPKSGDVHSIEMLYAVPRVLMGLLAIIDTLLIYKISERMYNRNVAFMASILFAVMPLGWMTRGIFLDSILLPLLLSSILFALQTEKIKKTENDAKSKNVMILMSGIFLGLAIFTKAPIITMIPLLAMIIIKNNRHDFRKVAILWLTPVILIPLLWPLYAVGTGHFEEWLNGVMYQIERDTELKLFHSMTLISKIDIVMLAIGTAGFVYTQIKRDYFLTLWAIPYLIFLSLIGWVTHFHWIVLFPVLCISGAILFEDISGRFRNKKVANVTRVAIILAIGVFGLATTISLITLNLNSSYFEIYAFLVKEIEDNAKANSNIEYDDEVLNLIGSHRTKALTWIPQYVLDINLSFRDTNNPKDNFTTPMKVSDRLLLIADSDLRSKLVSYPYGNEKDTRIGDIYYGTDTIATFINMKYDTYDFINTQANHGLGRFIEVKSNY